MSSAALGANKTKQDKRERDSLENRLLKIKLLVRVPFIAIKKPKDRMELSVLWVQRFCVFKATLEKQHGPLGFIEIYEYFIN